MLTDLRDHAIRRLGAAALGGAGLFACLMGVAHLGANRNIGMA